MAIIPSSDHAPEAERVAVAPRKAGAAWCSEEEDEEDEGDDEPKANSSPAAITEAICVGRRATTWTQQIRVGKNQQSTFRIGIRIRIRIIIIIRIRIGIRIIIRIRIIIIIRTQNSPCPFTASETKIKSCTTIHGFKCTDPL